MTDRFHTLTVVLEENVRDEDAASLIEAIHQMRGVLTVTGIVADYESHMAEARAKADLGAKIWDVIYLNRK